MLGAMIRMTRALTPDKGELYPAWQGMQYMHNMYSGTAKFERLDNDRYAMPWTKARDVLGALVSRGASPG